MSQNHNDIVYADNIQEFDVLDLLGKGGFASVYRARCKRSGTFVAIKMIDKKLMLAAGMVDRVKQEVSIHSTLKHPSILELYTFFEDIDHVYLVLELAENGELRKYLRENCKILTESEAANILRQILHGLLYLHSRNIIHRDMSLANLLLSRDWHVKIADFGLATQLTRPDERHMTMCGTPNYISPEVVSRASHGLPADVWSVGCMLYTMLVGRPPFETTNTKSTLTRVVMSDYYLPDNLSSDAKDLIDRLLRKNPNDRISLDNVLSHPFITRMGVAGRLTSINQSLDSGILTMSSGNSSRGGLKNVERPVKHVQNLPQLRQVSTESNGYSSFYGDRIGLMENKIEQPIRENRSNCILGDIRDRYLTSVHSGSSDPGGGMAGVSVGSGLNVDSIDYKRREEEFKFLEQRYNIGDHKQPIYLLDDPPPTKHIHRSIERPEVNRVKEIRPTQPKSIESKQIDVPPLSTERLGSTRFRNKKAVLSIDDNGEVILEFIRYKEKLRAERIVEVWRISPDGYRIIIYQPGGVRGVEIREQPPEIPSTGADSIYDYTNLPEKLWKKYAYASLFVRMVQSKTTKVTFYSEKAKCKLMESLDDFEMIFYAKEIKVTKTKLNGLRIQDSDGHLMSTNLENDPTVRVYHEHYTECLHHCQRLEMLLKNVSNPLMVVFPITIGRRPTVLGDSSQRPIVHNSINSMTPRTPNYPSSFGMSINSAETSRPQSRFSSHSTPISSIDKTGLNIRINVPQIGTITQFPNKTIEIEMFDDCRITILPDEKGGGVTVQCIGLPLEYFTRTDRKPLNVERCLLELPRIKRLLWERQKAIRPDNSSDIRTPIIRNIR